MDGDPDRLVDVIGVGAGDPAWLTLEAVRALEALDVAFVFVKGADDELAGARRALLPAGVREVAIEDPPRGRGAEAVAAWRAERVRLVREALAREPGRGGFLAWGDPTLYDGLIDVVREAGFGVRVLPGVSAVSALAARFGVTLNRVGGSVLLTSGRRLAASGWPAEVGDVVVMLDTELTFRRFPEAEIFWGAYLGTPDELLLSGVVAEVGPEIERVRSEARRRKGWMFDTYLLRRPGPA
ncbi:precorrin-6A synthase (deacetylating) [Solirubrobacter sp. CPCC 204708]|uniref:Precorrin-6A synthase (Deacetylating) n=1 Tax=Solirubrobacter deserti TaxID=2282478 RepID=A0ABT4RE23_9ACTN|nr:precorrin-6A synthase (deacetylating) [Solirubrobacter deserti]MBE2316016.1 precorrin-6A synthase (deacetylating) [Solirubrobacter deserti]MDA0136768.1 precorrin-6A synthase (deacetylating) [Solirubrobacter deserti]